MIFKLPLSLPLRLVLITIFFFITLITGLTITLISFRQSLQNRDVFAKSIGYHLSFNINQNLDRLIHEIEDFVNATERIYKKTNPSGNNHKNFLYELADHLIENPRYGTIVYKDELTGKTFILKPPTNDQFRYASIRSSITQSQDNNYTEADIKLREFIPNPMSGTVTEKIYQLTKYPEKPSEVIPDWPYNFNNAPWYLLGKSLPANSKCNWTEFSIFKNSDDMKKHGSGIHCVKSIFNDKGELAAIIGMEVGNYMINDYLATLLDDLHTEDLKGLIFEKHPDGSKVLIANSVRDDNLPEVERKNWAMVNDLNEMKDPIISSMIKNLPPEFSAIPDIPGHQIFPFYVQGKGYVGSAVSLVPGQTPWWVLCIYMPENVLYAASYKEFQTTLLITILIILASTILSIFFARKASKNLENLALFATKIGRLDFNHKIQILSPIEEFQNLAKSMALMQVGLKSFTQYLPKEMLKSLFDSGSTAKPGGKEKDVTIFFADIANFTHFSEILTPNDLVLQLNEYLGCFSSVINKSRGTVDKYIGDAVMAYWNAPKDCEDHAFKACQAALQGLHNLSFLQKEWARMKKPIFKVRIGINSGNVVLGNIGTEEHLSYTVVGDNVNLASRLEGLNKVYGTTIMISDFTLKACGGKLVTRPIDLVAVKGKEKKILAHELLGITNETSSKIVAFCNDFKIAFAAYLNKDWPLGVQLFEKIAVQYPDDLATKIHLERCRQFVINPPDPFWDCGQDVHQK
ncbi:MAG: adenylate/guanylate cyclase domain-containing protein [Planctomycetes bacterium]|nr:adenylate/guanylate cyclase domain-containing protein [Planctomycetota bacterium]NBY00713.1 adenylate/guanylate cyclase domain-containing protein [Planctomycetota bacterium]